MGLDRLPAEPPWLHEWMMTAIPSRGTPNDLVHVRNFIEAVITDSDSADAGLWQGDMPIRALSALDRVINSTRPIPVSERLPEAGVESLNYDPTAGDWYVGLIAKQPPGRITHWLPLPNNPAR